MFSYHAIEPGAYGRIEGSTIQLNKGQQISFIAESFHLPLE